MFVIVYQPPYIKYDEIKLRNVIDIPKAVTATFDLDQDQYKLQDYQKDYSITNLNLSIYKEPYPIGTIFIHYGYITYTQQPFVLDDTCIIVVWMIGQTLDSSTPYFDIIKENLKLDGDTYTVPNSTGLVLKATDAPNQDYKNITRTFELAHNSNEVNYGFIRDQNSNYDHQYLGEKLYIPQQAEIPNIQTDESGRDTQNHMYLEQAQQPTQEQLDAYKIKNVNILDIALPVTYLMVVGYYH